MDCLIVLLEFGFLEKALLSDCVGIIGENGGIFIEETLGGVLGGVAKGGILGTPKVFSNVLLLGNFGGGESNEDNGSGVGGRPLRRFGGG